MKKIKVLWFTNTPSCYLQVNKLDGKNSYNGGGWISSSEKVIRKNKDLELAVSFILDKQPQKVEQNGVIYYPIKTQKKNTISKIKCRVKTLIMNPQKYERSTWPFFLDQFKYIIEDFKPDIIHVWGSEQVFGLIWKITNTPVILHLQGIMNPYMNAYAPPGISWKDIVKKEQGLQKWLKAYYEQKIWKGSIYRETEIFKGITASLGRTDWDKRVAYCLNPQIKYYHVDEILREKFYNHFVRKLPKKLTIVTTISSPPYKGYDLILKTAQILKENLNLDFVWNCFGNINPRTIEKIIGIQHENVNVKLMGVASSEQLCKMELSATLYFHPSYIDNSPNSLCEAQMLGLPIIATNVGGISSLVTDGKDGFLIPANDPYQAAYFIEHLANNPNLNITMGENGKKKAYNRHNPQKIISQILNTYKSIIGIE